MSDQPTWSRKKKDRAPRGVFRHPSGVWAVRFTCGAGHIHQERVGLLKGAAVRIYHERRARALAEPGWCPAVERAGARTVGLTFRQAAADYETWARDEHRSFKNTQSELRRLTAAFGDRPLATVTAADVERFLAGLREGRADATVNRYRDRLSGLYTRAVRLGQATMNPVTGIKKATEPGGRVVYLTDGAEEALLVQLAPELRPLVTFSLHTGLRWSEQAGIRWADVDLLANVVTIRRSKNGRARRVALNSTVTRLLVDLAAARTAPGDSTSPVFPGAVYRTVSRAFLAAVKRAQAALRDAGRDDDVNRLEGYTWHGNRHSFASRLVMAGVDLLTVQTLGGWRTAAMVQRYAHLAPAHLACAVERLVAGPRAVELRRNFDGASLVGQAAP